MGWGEGVSSSGQWSRVKKNRGGVKTKRGNDANGKEMEAEQMTTDGDLSLFRFRPVVFVLLGGSQQLLDILGDLFGFADDVLCAGQRGV